MTPNTAALSSIAGQLASQLDETALYHLITYDYLIRSQFEGQREEAAAILRGAALNCPEEARRNLLLAAADRIAAGGEGYIWAENVVRGVSAEEAPAIPVDEEERTPHLPVPHFFWGMTLRVVRGFEDRDGRKIEPGGVLQLSRFHEIEGGWYLGAKKLEMVLDADDQDEIIENEGNAWFQPVARVTGVRYLLENLDEVFAVVERGKLKGEKAADAKTLRQSMQECQRWLKHRDAPIPICPDVAVAERLLGARHKLTAWFRLLATLLPQIGPARQD